MTRTVNLTKKQAADLNITGAKPSASVKVGANTLYQPARGRIHQTNNLAGLCYTPKRKQYAI